MAPAETERCIHPQQPARRHPAAAQALFEFLQFGQDTPALGQVGLALGRDRQPPRGAVEQPHAQPRLQRRQPLAGRRRRDAKLLRRAGKAAALDQQDEEGEIREGVHG
ncbi:hypothetical protein D3C72_1512060 [compost metagenome]